MPLAEVVPSLQRGVVDCGITGTLTGHSFKWPEVTKNPLHHALRLGPDPDRGQQGEAGTRSPKDRQEATRKAVSTLEQELWALAASDDKAGVDCNTGRAASPLWRPCRHGAGRAFGGRRGPSRKRIPSRMSS